VPNEGQPTKKATTTFAGSKATAANLKITSFTVTGPASWKFAFPFPPYSYPGNLFVPVEFTITNVGTSTSRPLSITAHCLLLGKTTRECTFLDNTVTLNKSGGGGSTTSAKAGKLGKPAPLPGPALGPGDKLTVKATLAVPVGDVRDNVQLWITLDSQKSNVRTVDIPKAPGRSGSPGDKRQVFREKVRAIKNVTLEPAPEGAYPKGTMLLNVAPLTALLREPPETVELRLMHERKVIATVGRFGPGGKGAWSGKLVGGNLLPVACPVIPPGNNATLDIPGYETLTVNVLMVAATSNLLQQQHTLNMINQYRAKATPAAKPLTLDSKLHTFAVAASQELMQDHVAHKYFTDHPGTAGGECQGNWNGHPIVGWPKANVEATIDQILASMMSEPLPPPNPPGYNHHSIIIDQKYTKLGVGLVVDKAAGKLYFTIDFAP
jgi:hypothetical protein